MTLKTTCFIQTGKQRGLSSCDGCARRQNTQPTDNSGTRWPSALFTSVAQADYIMHTMGIHNKAIQEKQFSLFHDPLFVIANKKDYGSPAGKYLPDERIDDISRRCLTASQTFAFLVGKLKCSRSTPREAWDTYGVIMAVSHSGQFFMYEV